MATDTAVHPATRTAPDATSHVWQVPIFLLGLAVFVAVWRGWLPLGTPDPSADFERDMLALRTAYERVTPDRDELKDLLKKVGQQVDAFPEQTAAVNFALGSGYMRLAELTGDLEEARTHWMLAKQHLEQVRAEDLRDQSEAPKLAFRAAKARAAVGLAANAPASDLRLHITLLGNVPFGEEPGEAGRLQAALALRLAPPDLQTARAGLETYLTRTGVATPAVSLARGRLLLGEIYQRLNQPERAKSWLEQIGLDSPPNVVGPAKLLIARIKMKDNDWLGATRDLDAARALPSLDPALRLASAYHLGVCKVRTREAEPAAKLFAEAVKGDGPEAQAAAVELAELDLKATGPDGAPDRARHMEAVDLLGRALKGVTDPKQVRSNPYLRPSDIQPIFEMAVSVLVADEQFEAALKAIEIYKPLSAPGRDREKRAEVFEAWATTLQKQNGDYKGKASTAAAEYEAVAAVQPAATAKADIYRRAAKMYRFAGEHGKAVDCLQKVLQLPQLADAVSATAWADLADSLIAAKRPDEVWPAFNAIMASATPVSTATRYRLAHQFVKSTPAGFAQLGRQLFEQIARQETVAPEEQEYHELALSELTHELIKSGSFTEAEVWARKQISLYPTGVEAGLGRLFLGICLLQRAAAPPPAGADAAVSAASADRMREEALTLFKQIMADVEGRIARDKKPADRDLWLRLQAGLRVLQAYQQLQRPNDLLAEASPMLERHRGTVEELIIWSMVYHAFRQKNEPGKALQTRDQMRELFDRLRPDQFRGTDGEYSRAYWEKVWFAPDAKSK
ncbi:MAG TPA: hypothetical protein VLM40_17615 [Gemmata sp.]|nr:hypothetical protein [Gemmata sp.]